MHGATWIGACRDLGEGRGVNPKIHRGDRHMQLFEREREKNEPDTRDGVEVDRSQRERESVCVSA